MAPASASIAWNKLSSWCGLHLEFSRHLQPPVLRELRVQQQVQGEMTSSSFVSGAAIWRTSTTSARFWARCTTRSSCFSPSPTEFQVV